MGNYEQLKQSVSNVIKTNGNQEITGSILQNVLLTIISTVGANATFAGIATPSTNPGTPDGSVFWLASESGTYSNFGGVELQDGLSVLMWNGSWGSQQIFGIDDVPTKNSDNLVKSGGTFAAFDSVLGYITTVPNVYINYNSTTKVLTIPEASYIKTYNESISLGNSEITIDLSTLGTDWVTIVYHKSTSSFGIYNRDYIVNPSNDIVVGQKVSASKYGLILNAIYKVDGVFISDLLNNIDTEIDYIKGFNESGSLDILEIGGMIIKADGTYSKNPGEYTSRLRLKNSAIYLNSKSTIVGEEGCMLYVGGMYSDGTPIPNSWKFANGGSYTCPKDGMYAIILKYAGSNEIEFDGETYTPEDLASHIQITNTSIVTKQLDDVPTKNSDNLVKSGGVQQELALGAVYDVSAKNPTAGVNNDGKWKSLSALLSDANLSTLIPTPVRKGGMSIKFIQSSDNKYVQARCMAQNFTTDVTQWQGVSDEPVSESEDLVKGSGVLSKYAPLGGIIYRNKNSMNNNHTVRFDVGYTCWNKDMILTWDSNSSINMVSIHCYSKDYEQQLLNTTNDIFNVPQNTAIIVATFDNGDSSTTIEVNLSFYGTSQKLDKILQKNWDFGYSYGQLPNVDTLGMTINFGSSAYIKLPYIGIDLGNFTDIPLVDTSLTTSLQLLVYNITQNSFTIKSYTYSPKDDEIILCITRWSTHEPVQKVLDVFSKFDVTYDGIRNPSGLVLTSITSIDKLWGGLEWYTQYHTRVIFEIDNTPYSELNISLDANQDYDVDVLNAENWEGTHYDETGWKKSVLGYKATKKDAKKIFVLFRKSNNEEITVADVALIKAAIVQCDIKNILLKGNANNNLLYQLNRKIAIDKNPNIISIAHQGFCFNNPSQFSTKEAFLRAADYGFRWTEGDIKFSSDLVPVLNHDLTFEDATTHQTITISEHTYAELLTYDYKGGTICSFDEVLAICKTSGMGFVIDHLDWTVDTDQKLNIIFGIVKKYRMENNVIWNIQNNGKVDKITQFCKNSIFQILNGYSSESLSLANAIKTDFNRVIISQDIILDRQGTPRAITPQEIIAFAENVNNGIELSLWTFDYISTFNTLAPYVTWVTTNILTF